eukprot:1140048-Ditylum_brightwellii.AAC.1
MLMGDGGDLACLSLASGSGFSVSVLVVVVVVTGVGVLVMCLGASQDGVSLQFVSAGGGYLFAVVKGVWRCLGKSDVMSP